jgi:cysteine desulfurase/selenocysteine lyase
MKMNRQDFPMLSKTMHGKPLVYLDSAATAQKPFPVIQAITNYYENHYGTVHRAVYELSVEATKSYQDTRVKLQKLLNARLPEEIIFTRGTTESINLVASSFGERFIEAGDEVLITEMEHHSNIVPWQLLCERKGAVLKVAPMDDSGVLIREKFTALLSPKTKIAAIAHVSNSLGTINPIKELIAEAHAVGAKVLIDAAQSAPHFNLDVQDLDCDFLVFSGHKFYGPTGIGVLYGKEALFNEMPPYQGGGDMIDKVTFEKTTYGVLPLKFEAGTPMIAEVIGLGAALDFVNKIGLNSIRGHEHLLLEAAEKELSSIPGLKIIGTAPEKSGIISFVVDGVHHLDIGTMLDLKGIAIRTGHHCAQPVMQHFKIPGTARASFGLYNTHEDVERFVQSLKEALCVLR